MKQILVVDDNEETRCDLLTLLTSCDYKVEAACHGEEAMAKARQSPPDLIIADLLMPVMDGYTLLRHWKADSQLKSIPFIVHAPTYAGAEDESLALDLGADAFVARPAPPAAFLARVREVLATTARSVPSQGNRQAGAEEQRLALYNEALIQKLEQRTLQLEEANRALQQEIVNREQGVRKQQQMAETQKAILDALPGHIALVDPQGVILSVNEAWRRFATANVLQGPDFCVGQNYLRVCEQATGDCSEEARDAAVGIRRVLAGEMTEFSIEYPCHAPNEPRWFRLMVTALREHEHAGAVIMHVNVTARRVAEGVLRDSEQRLNFALAAADIGDWSLDLRSNVVQRSLRHDRCFGYQELLPEWGYDTFLAHVDQADRERVEAGFMKALAGAGEYEEQFRTTWPDGSLHWLWTKGRFYFDDAGKPLRVAGILADITGRKKSESALVRTLERLTEAQRIGKIGDWEWDIAKQAITWSPQVFEIMGRDPQLGPPRDYEEQADFFEAASWTRMRGKVTRALDSGEMQDYELTVLQPGGKRVEVQAMALARRDESGRVACLYGTVQDISERRQAEAALIRSEQRLELATASAHMGIWDWDLLAKKQVWTPQMYALYGLREQDFAGPAEAWQEVLHPADRARAEAETQAALSGKSNFHTEFRVRWPGGEVRHIESHGLVQRADDGSPTRMIGANWDITERKRSETRMRRLIESNVQGVVFWNTAGAITAANDAFLAMVGYNRQELEAGCLNWIAMTPPEFAEKDRRTLAEMATKGVGTPFEKEFIRKDGTRVPVITGAAVFEDSPQEGVCFVVDLSERKKLEQQFLRAQRMESLGTLAGGIAHDLNNALAPILLSIDLLKMEMSQAKRLDLLSTIDTCAQRGADMVSQLLSFARGVDGRRLEVQVRHLLRDVAKIATDTFPKNIEIRTDTPQYLWTLSGDPTQLHQVLLNLCVNARDAMPDGGILTLSASNTIQNKLSDGLVSQSQAGAYVMIQVQDNGTGIPQQIIEKIFDPFFTTKEIGKGTGLGLSTSMAIIKSHGGFIRVYSEPDQGTRFRIYLPAATAGAAADPVVQQPRLPRGEGECVLVVDDEASVRNVTRQTLESFGYRVLLANNGAEAIALYAARRDDIAVVLTDMMMPVLDGPATIQVLLKMNPRVRIIAASGLVTEDRRANAMSAGVKHLLVKPYTAEVLLNTLQAVLQAPRGV